MTRPRVSSAAAVLAAVLALALLAGCAGPRRPAGDDAPTLATLEARSVELPADPGIRTDEWQAMAAYRSYLEVAREPAQRAEVMQRLADLEMDLADRQAADAGATPDYRAAVAQYERLLKEHPDARANDRVLYQLARAQEQAGELDKALATLTRLARAYPDSVHRDEVNFRRGELLFATRDYAAAGEAYGTLVRKVVTSPFAERALYMRGWSLYKQAKLEDALASFFSVLDQRLARLAPGPDPLAHLSRAERELLEDTHRVMSIALASLKGPASIGPYITSRTRRGYEHRVYVELAELYLKQERPKDAADTLAYYARERPLETPAPELLARVIEIHEKHGFPSLALEAKRDFVVRYGRDSDFRRGNAEGWAAAQPRVKAHLIELARHHHAAHQQGKAREDLQQAVRWYRELLASFPDDADAAGQRFLLAELLFEDRQFAAAAAEYETVAYRRSGHPRAADAGYGALLAYAEQDKAATAEERAALRRTSIDSALRFAGAFPADPRAGSVTTNAAEQLLAAGESERAATVARQALAGPASADEQRTAWTVIGISAFDRGQFAEAEQAYGEAFARAPEGSARAGELAERRAAAAYRQGELARSAGRAREAIGHFERVAALAPASAVRAAAQFDAAAALLGLKDWAAASASLEDFRRRFPGHALQSELPPKLALAYTEQKRWADAAGEYDRIGAGDGAPDLRRSAMWQAAELHRRAAATGGSRRAAAAAFERYVEAWSQPLEPAVEARWQLAQYALADGQAAPAQRQLRALREVERNGGAGRTPRTKSLAALAAIELSAPQLEAYRRINLVEPLAANLKLKKARMELVLQAYAAAAEDGAAEGITAATFHTAALYQDFGKALLGSQRPRRLKKAELEQYNVMLEEQAFPFEEKAIQLYETNAQRTTQGLYDQWVRRSMVALATLKPVRWGKTERSEEAIDALR